MRGYAPTHEIRRTPRRRPVQVLRAWRHPNKVVAHSFDAGAGEVTGSLEAMVVPVDLDAAGSPHKDEPRSCARNAQAHGRALVLEPH